MSTFFQPLIGWKILPIASCDTISLHVLTYLSMCCSLVLTNTLMSPFVDTFSALNRLKILSIHPCIGISTNELTLFWPSEKGTQGNIDCIYHRPRGNPCLTFGLSQSQRSIFMNSRSWLAANRRKKEAVEISSKRPRRPSCLSFCSSESQYVDEFSSLFGWHRK